MEAVLRAALVLMSVLPEVERAWGQRAPCYECEVYKDSHPQSKPYEEIRSHCSYPCECGDRTEEPVCTPGVSVVRDGCGCCAMCARQQGETCDGTTLCDEKRGLVCQYPRRGAAKGVCQAIKGLPCTVYNRTYENGETFLLDCRTQCACQNGTYACASLCPQEYISPQGSCRHPRLVEVPGQCCREWMCDSASAQHPPDCRQEYSQWSPCSSPCGLGLSHRVSNLNPQCIPANESRICQVRTCSQQQLQRHHLHHVRKGHECKATQRVSGPVRLRFGPCRSRKRFRPKSCGACTCCTPQLSTTVKVEFRCAVTASNHEDERDLLLDLVEPGADLWWPDNTSPPHQLTTTALPPPPPPPPLRRYAYQVHRGGAVGRPTWRRRMAFRPMEEEEEETQEEEEREDKDDNEEEERYRTIFFSVQWILKCHCSENCGEIATARPTNGDGEVILHRVHRTAAP